MIVCRMYCLAYAGSEVGWAVFYSDIFECVPGLAMWVLCVNCGMGNTCPGLSICERGLVPHFRSSFRCIVL